MNGHNIRISDEDYALLQCLLTRVRERGHRTLPQAAREHLGAREASLSALVGAGVVLLISQLDQEAP